MEQKPPRTAEATAHRWLNVSAEKRREQGQCFYKGKSAAEISERNRQNVQQRWKKYYEAKRQRERAERAARTAAPVPHE